jgi:hypothetical protein
MIDFSQVLRDLDGNAIQDIRQGADGQPVSVEMTLGRCAANALLGTVQGETLEGKDHVRRYVLAGKVRAGGELAIEADDIVLIKERIAKLYASPTVVGLAWLLLDPACGGGNVMLRPRRK